MSAGSRTPPIKILNFDAIRVVAALMVVISHSWPIALGLPDPAISGVSLGSIGVFVFFFTSGYLVSLSALRTPETGSFFLNRALRIYPGLVACVLVTTFLVGPAYTAMPIWEYLFDPHTYLYLRSGTALTFQASLPGVFTSSYLSTVNGSLWTLPYEIACYAVFGTLIMYSPKRYMRTAVLCTVSITLFLNHQILSELNTDSVFSTKIGKFAPLCVAYAIGAIAALSPHHLRPAAFGIFGTISAAFWFYPESLSYVSRIGAAGAVACGTGLLALHAPQVRLLPANLGDPSYGIYIYAFPIQQIVAIHLPPSSAAGHFAYIALCAALAIVVGIASWKYIEKPALRFKR